MTLHFDRFENGVVIAEVLRSLHQEVALEMCHSGAGLSGMWLIIQLGSPLMTKHQMYKYDFKTGHI